MPTKKYVATAFVRETVTQALKDSASRWHDILNSICKCRSNVSETFTDSLNIIDDQHSVFSLKVTALISGVGGVLLQALQAS